METFFLFSGYFFYVLYFTICLSSVAIKGYGRITKERIFDCSPFLLVFAIIFHGIAIILRWGRLGHGPYLGQYEGLLSGLWISGLFYVHMIIARKNLRRTGIIGGFFIVLWSTWLIITDRADTILPAVYKTWWIVVHILFGKLSYGALFPVFVLSVYYIISRLGDGGGRDTLHGMEKIAYRYMAMAFTFATAMMVGGGIWAQMAWGRAWTWKALEAWSLVLWLIYGLYIHLRITYNSFKKIWVYYIIFAYILTFYNLFGVPFLSATIHKGVL